MKNQITITLSDRAIDDLEALSKKAGWSKSRTIEEAILAVADLRRALKEFTEEA